MEENVALDTSKQKQFVKSIKGIKKLIKKTEEEVPEPVIPKAKDEKKLKRKRPDRGLVYLSHIPHGFYEHEMTQYFKQFGAVSNVRVIRSKRTGNSRGCAFIEFKQPAVADIVAETMNNYLMGKRLLKAVSVPPEKQRIRAMRKHWNRFNNPGRNEQLKHKKGYNKNRNHDGELARARKTLSKYQNAVKRLSDIGINYDFFTPVDIPEELVASKDSQKTTKDESKPKKNKDTVQKDNKVQKKINETNAVQETAKDKKKANSKKEKNVPEPVNKKEQKQKQKKLKNAGVKPPENFIKVQEDDDDDSDSSAAEFNSDDYSKMMEDDSDADSGEESDGDNDPDEPGSDDEFEITGSDDDDSEVKESEDEQVIPPKKGKSRDPVVALPIPSKKQTKQMAKAHQQTQKSTERKGKKAKQFEKAPQRKEPIAPEVGKRKAPQKNAVSPKKPKFEKQTQQPMKKHLKKKK